MRRPSRAALAAIVLLAAKGALAAEAPSADPEAAAKQYRVARRLVAEGSPDASGALAKVYDLDPTGPLADDALVEQALLLGIAAWPGELGRVAAAEADRAGGLLGRASDSLPNGDRVSEARVLRALLRLEPLPGRDPARARLEFLAVGSGASDERWRTAARLGVAWIDERSGERARARSAYQRLAIDQPATAVGSRARARLAMLLLRDGNARRAAALLEEVAESGADAGGETAALRDLAVRTVLRGAKAGGRWAGGTVVTSASGLRGIAAAARLRDGGLLLADRKDDVILELAADGTPGTRWTLPGVQALTEDPMGRRFAAAGERLYRLLPSGPVAVAQLGDFESPSAIAADGWGRLFVLDRHGEKIGMLEPGAPSPATLLGSGGKVRLAGLVWDGVRLVGLDAKTKWVVEVLPDGTLRPVAAIPCEKPEAIAADPAGGVAVLDRKTDEVVLLGSDGEVRERLPIRGSGLERADMIVLGADGSLDVLAEGSGTTVRFP
jgi:hypothetical protein